jgi:hypothetical protein
LADKPSETSTLKLEFNYALAHEEDIANKDSKMTSYPKESIFRVVVPVKKQDSSELGSHTETIRIPSPSH